MLQIEHNFSLKNFNTFGVEASARYFVEINHEDDLVELFMDPQWQHIKRLVLGGDRDHPQGPFDSALQMIETGPVETLDTVSRQQVSVRNKACEGSVTSNAANDFVEFGMQQRFAAA